MSVSLSGGGIPKDGISKLAKTDETSGFEKKHEYSLKDGKCSRSCIENIFIIGVKQTMQVLRTK